MVALCVYVCVYVSIQADPKKFPSGMKALGDYSNTIHTHAHAHAHAHTVHCNIECDMAGCACVDSVHSQGLKFGIYSDAGSNTCGGYPGSRGHEKQDAQSYASWVTRYMYTHPHSIAYPHIHIQRHIQ